MVIPRLENALSQGPRSESPSQLYIRLTSSERARLALQRSSVARYARAKRDSWMCRWNITTKRRGATRPYNFSSRVFLRTICGEKRESLYIPPAEIALMDTGFGIALLPASDVEVSYGLANVYIHRTRCVTLIMPHVRDREKFWVLPNIKNVATTYYNLQCYYYF